jgi:hypothetical protein
MQRVAMVSGPRVINLLLTIHKIINRIPRDGQLVRLPVQLRMSTYNILVSVRRILVVNEYSLRKNWEKLVQQNGKLDECRLLIKWIYLFI